MEIKQFDPQLLAVHKSLDIMPSWSEEDPRFFALCDDIKENGVREPVKVMLPPSPRSDGKKAIVVDGRHRVRAAKRMGLLAVPCIVVPESEVAGIIIATLLHRRHYSKSALAYLAFPFLKTAYDEANARKLALIKTGKVRAGTSLAGSVEELSDQLGISRRLFDYAREVHEIFEQDPDYKALKEPAILSDDPEESVALSRVKAGWAGKKSTAGKPRVATQQLELFSQGYASLGRYAGYWTKLDPEEQGRAKLEIRKAVAQMPPELRSVMVAEIKRAEKEAAIC